MPLTHRPAPRPRSSTTRASVSATKDSKNCRTLRKSKRVNMICETSVASGTHSRTYLKNILADQRSQRSNFMNCKFTYFVCTRNLDKILAVRKYAQIGRRYGRATTTGGASGCTRSVGQILKIIGRTKLTKYPYLGEIFFKSETFFA